MVIAVGGNSLIVSEDRQAIPDQYEAAVATVKHIVNLSFRNNQWRAKPNNVPRQGS